jgi:glycosyltransferase involved in cell wall biosynthesis
MPGRGGKPHLLVLNQYFDTVEASGQVLVDMCEDLLPVADVTVVAARPKRQLRGAAGRDPRVRVIWTRSPQLEKSFFPFRVINYLGFLVSALATAPLTRRPAVVLCMTDPPVIGLIGLAVATLRRARFLLVCQDIHPDVGIVSGRLTSRPIIALLRLAQRVTLGGADHVVAIGDAMRQRLIQRGAAPDAVSVIPNWASLDAIQPEPRDNPWAQRHSLTGSFTVMHSGNVGLLQGLEALVDAAVEAPEAQFVIVGEGSGKEALGARVRASAVKNVSFVPHQSRAELSHSLASADVHVVSLVPGLAGFIEPSKIYGVLAAGRPVIAAVDEESEAARLVNAAGCGVVVPPGDASALAEAVRRLAKLPNETLIDMGKAARATAETHCDRSRAGDAYRRLVAAMAA